MAYLGLSRLLGVFVLCNIVAVTSSTNSTKDCGETLMKASDDFNFLYSPGFPASAYENNMDCTWTIETVNSSQVVQAEVLYSSLQGTVSGLCINDNVTAYDGPSTRNRTIWTWCSMETPDILSTKRSLTLHFKTDGSVTYTGFRLRYRQTTARCEKQLFAEKSRKYDYSLGHQYSYRGSTLETHTAFPALESNLSCSWTIRTRNTNIKLVVANFKSPSNSCLEELVKVYDGESKNLLESLCDHGKPTYISSTALVRIDFVTVSNVQHKGFLMSYTGGQFSNISSCGSDSLYASAYARYLTSPGYPDYYPNNLNCTWTIRTSYPIIKLTVMNSALESSVGCTADRVMVFGGRYSNVLLRTFCGSERPTTISSSSTLKVVFITDGSNRNRGFRMRYTASRICGPSSLTALPYTKYLTSPGYPNDYKNNLKCKWVITTSRHYTIRLIVLKADIEPSTICGSDYLTVYDGSSVSAPRLDTLCGKGRPIYTSTRNFLTVTFTTDSSVEAGGFRLSYRSGNFIDSNGCGSRSLRAYGFAKNLTSPGYPNYYQNNLDCKWIITAYNRYIVKVTVLDAGMKSYGGCTGDNVKVYDGSTTTDPLLGTFCRGTNRIFTSTDKALMVRFQTDASGGGRGFRLSYQSLKVSCTQKKVTAFRTYTKELTSPRYPLMYPDNADCSWVINVGSSHDVVYLEVTHLDIEYSYGCYKDFLKAIDDNNIYGSSLGTWCGTQIPPVTQSSWQFMAIQFHSNGNTRKSGFRLQYSAIKSRSINYHKPSSYGGIVGGILGGFVLLVVVICCASCRARKIRRTPSGSHGVRTTSEQTQRSMVFVVGNHNAEYIAPAAFTGPPSYDEVMTNDQGHRAGAPPPYSSLVAASGKPVNNLPSEMPKYGQTAVVDEPESGASDRHLNTTRDSQGQDNLPSLYNSFDATSDVLANTSAREWPLDGGTADVGNIDEAGGHVNETHSVLPTENASGGRQGVCNPALTLH